MYISSINDEESNSFHYKLESPLGTTRAETSGRGVVRGISAEPSSGLEENRAIKVLQQLTVFCDGGGNLRKVLAKKSGVKQEK